MFVQNHKSITEGKIVFKTQKLVLGYKLCLNDISIKEARVRYDYITIGNACQQLGMGRDTLKMFVEQGKVPGVQCVETRGDRTMILIPRVWVGEQLRKQGAEIQARIAALESAASSHIGGGDE